MSIKQLFEQAVAALRTWRDEMSQQWKNEELFLAAAEGRADDAVELIMVDGADVFATNEDGHFCFDVALAHGKTATAQAIIQASIARDDQKRETERAEFEEAYAAYQERQRGLKP